MGKPGRLILFIAVAVGSLALDQVVKVLARVWLYYAPILTFFNDTLRLRYTENPGALLGFGARLPETVRTAGVALLIAVIVVGALVYLGRAGGATRLQAAALGLLAGGGAGNLVDRLLNQGRVIDYLQFRLGPLETGIFNLADFAVLAGVLALLLEAAKEKKEEGAEILS